VHAEMTLLQLIKLNPNHSGGLCQLARVLIDSLRALPEEGMKEGTRKRAIDYYEKYISLAADVSLRARCLSSLHARSVVVVVFPNNFCSFFSPHNLQPSSALIEYLQVVNTIGDASEKVSDYCSQALSYSTIPLCVCVTVIYGISILFSFLFVSLPSLLSVSIKSAESIGCCLHSNRTTCLLDVSPRRCHTAFRLDAPSLILKRACLRNSL
jgi:hypothetical protein